VLDIEVVWIMEDGDWSARVNGRGAVIAAGSVSTAGSFLRRNGNGIQRDWWSRMVGDCGHDDGARVEFV
jgi:hypothetical protein